MAIPTGNLSNVAFSSQFRYEHVALRGNKTFTMGTNEFYNLTTITIPHNLGYKPYFRLYMQFPGSTRIYQIEAGPNSYALVNMYQLANFGSDTANITVEIESYNNAGGTGTIYYRIYKERQ